MKARVLSKSIIRSVNDFNLLRKDIRWSGIISKIEQAKYYKLKLEYDRSRTEM